MEIPSSKRLKWLFSRNLEMKQIAERFERDGDITIMEKLKLISYITGKKIEDLEFMLKINILLEEAFKEKGEAE
jgi:hypothetical protein